MEIIIAIIGSGALSALISGLFTIFNQHRKKSDGVRDGVRQLLYDRIKYLGRRYIADKAICSEDLEDLIEMHNIYHSGLDGNGYLDSIMGAVKSLPICEAKTDKKKGEI